jgi:hypothetical protein
VVDEIVKVTLNGLEERLAGFDVVMSEKQL